MSTCWVADTQGCSHRAKFREGGLGRENQVGPGDRQQQGLVESHFGEASALFSALRQALTIL